jgi:hypothetical protein
MSSVASIGCCIAGPFRTTKDTAQAAGWADRYTVQGFATVGGRLWRYTGDGTGTNRSDPAALTEYDWNSGGEVARHNEPKDIGYLGPGTRWEPEGLTIVRTAPDQIRVLWGVARGPTGQSRVLDLQLRLSTEDVLTGRNFRS